MNSDRRRTSVAPRSVRNPFGLAAAVTRDSRSDRIQDDVVQRLRSGRTAVGVVATVWMLAAYPLAQSGEDILLGKLVDVLAGCAITFVAGLVCLSVFIGAARPPLRRLYVRRLTGPGSALGAILGCAALAAGVAVLLPRLTRGEIIPWADARAAGVLVWLLCLLLFLVLLLGGLIVVVVAALFTLGAVVYALNSCFRVGDVHELLPALISPFLVWALFVLSLFDGPDVAAPPLVLYTFLLGGPLSVTLLSVWEIRRLNRRYGVTFRSALGRERDAAPEPVGIPAQAPPPAFGEPSPYAAYPPQPTYPPYSS
ncbi:hypothetical protein ABT142_19275 [Streptomyces sp. NPDC001857]|uniref:hypothetical protein n=1 Tax=unclassified Streptomyces TaxID=2593676 RepID=UPI0033196CDE